jgi:hypothetical protein
MEAVRAVGRPLKRRAYELALRFESQRLGGSVNPHRLKRIANYWGNEGYRGNPAYLEAVAQAAARADGPILECGSGVTTIVAAAYSRHEVWSLEHLPEWANRTRTFARNGARVLDTRLRSYGDFDWYELPEFLPDRFALVICDGPPGQTRGGRYGLMPVMYARLCGATVLLDDTNRESERNIAERWCAEFGVEMLYLGRHAVLTYGGS